MRQCITCVCRFLLFCGTSRRIVIVKWYEPKRKHIQNGLVCTSLLFLAFSFVYNCFVFVKMHELYVYMFFLFFLVLFIFFFVKKGNFLQVTYWITYTSYIYIHTHTNKHTVYVRFKGKKKLKRTSKHIEKRVNQLKVFFLLEGKSKKKERSRRKIRKRNEWKTSRNSRMRKGVHLNFIRINLLVRGRKISIHLSGFHNSWRFSNIWI